ADISTALPPLVIDYEAPLADYLAGLYARGITSVLVEGGSDTLQRFIDAGLWDEAREEIAPVNFGDEGCAPAPKLAGKPLRSIHIGPNCVNLYSHEACRHVKNL
ncbi:MAG: dihydrofolate reductase family protein, partial [Muribaculaceae bacterium]|nr:dihydrofolate reductase family protein [Muribaculaceae bacterium]